MAVTSVTVKGPPDAVDMPSNVARPAVSFIWAGGTGPWDAEVTWDDDVTFGNANGNRQIVTQTGITPIAETTIVPTADLANRTEGRQWYVRVKVTDTFDAGSVTNSTIDFTYRDPKLYNRFLHGLANVGYGFKYKDAPIPAQIISVNATGGTYTVSLDGVGPSAAIGFDATQGAVKTAIEGLANVTTVTVTKLQAQQWLVRMDNVSPNPIPAFAINSAGLTGGTATGTAVEYVDDAARWGTGGTQGPDGDDRMQGRFLHLISNVGFGFEPFDRPTAGWGQAIGGTVGPDGWARDLSRFLHLEANITTTQPCPFLFSSNKTFVQSGDAITVTGQGLVSATAPTADAWGAELRLYASQDLGGSYVTLSISSWTAGETSDTITATVPGGATSGFLAVVHTVGASCAGSNFIGITVVAVVTDRQAGWWAEVWNLRNTTALIRPLPNVAAAVFEQVANDLGSGSIILPSDHPDLTAIIDRSTSPPVQRLVKIYLHGRMAYSFIPEDVEEVWGDDGARQVLIYGQGHESQLRWGRALWADFPAQPARARPWLYGSSENALTDGDMEPGSAITNGGLEDAIPDPWGATGSATIYAGSDSPRTGSFALEITPTALNGGARIDFQVEHNWTTFADLYVKDPLASGDGFTVDVLDSDGSTVLATQTINPVTALWNKVTLSWTPSAGGVGQTETNTLRIRQTSGSPHRFFVDDAAVYTKPSFDMTLSRATAALSRTYVGDGLHSLRIVADAGADALFNGAVVFFDVDPNQKYTATYRVTGPVGKVVRIGLRLGGNLDFADVTLSGLGTWDSVTLTGTAGPEDDRGRFAISSRDAASLTFYLDAVQITPGEPAETAGNIALDVLSAIQARGTLDWVTTDFSATADSTGNPWPETLAMEVQPEWTMLDLLDKLVGLGYSWEYNPQNWRAGGESGFTLRLYRPLAGGTDWTLDPDGPTILPGRGLTDVDSSQAPPASTVVYAEGHEGVWSATSAPSSTVSALERREDFISSGSARDTITLNRTASYRLSQALTRGEQWSATFRGDTDPLPYYDFLPADRMRAHLPQEDRTIVADATYRVAAIAARLDDEMEFEVDLGHYRLHAEEIASLLLQRLVRRDTTEQFQPGTGRLGG